MLLRLFCQIKYVTKFMVTPSTYYIIYGRKLYNIICIWVIYLFFKPKLLNIGLISMHCKRGYSKKSTDVSILFKQNSDIPNNFYL